MMSWEDSLLYCTERGANLSSIQSAEENTFVTNLLVPNSVWIGFIEKTSEDMWVWSDGSAVSYTNWYPGEPNNNDESDYCAQIYYWSAGRGFWNDRDCSTMLYGLCEFPLEPQPTSPPTDEPSSIPTAFLTYGPTSSPTEPPTYTPTYTPSKAPTPTPTSADEISIECLDSQRSCYFMTGTMMSWEDSLLYCTERGANLSSIQSAEENTFVSNFLVPNSLWIGFNDKISEGMWLWSDGSAVSYTNWYPGEPNNHESEHCAQIYYWSAGRGFWNDQECSTMLYGLCELPLEPQPTSLPTDEPSSIPTAFLTYKPTSSPTEPPTYTATYTPSKAPTPTPTSA